MPCICSVEFPVMIENEFFEMLLVLLLLLLPNQQVIKTGHTMCKCTEHDILVFGYTLYLHTRHFSEIDFVCLFFFLRTTHVYTWEKMTLQNLLDFSEI